VDIYESTLNLKTLCQLKLLFNEFAREKTPQIKLKFLSEVPQDSLSYFSAILPSPTFPSTCLVTPTKIQGFLYF
jgi:hypothetical protein